MGRHIRRNTNSVHVPSNNFALIEPEEITIGFDELFGHEELKKDIENLAMYLRSPELYKEYKPYFKYILVGASGIGKETFACAFAKKVNIPILVVESSFFYNTQKLMEELDNVFNEIYFQMYSGRNCILLFKNLENLFTLEIKTSQPFIERLIGYFRDLPELVTFATVAETLKVPTPLCESPAFTKIVSIEVPELKTREKALIHFLEPLKVDKSLNIHQLAGETLNMYIGDIKQLVKSAFLIQRQNRADSLSYEHFAEAMAQTDFGFSKNQINDFEKIAIARHEAGHVVAGYFSNPQNYNVTKVDITPRAFYGGITLESPDETQQMFFKKDIESKIIMCFGGMAAEELFYGSPSSGIENDLEQATALAINMVKSWGMSELVGPVCLTSDDFSLTKIDTQADLEVRNILITSHSKAVALVKEKVDVLNKLTKELLEKEVLYKKEIMDILNQPN